MKQEDLIKLAAATPAKEKKTRNIKGRNVDYVDARFVQDRLDSVCGIGQWQCFFRKEGYGFICRIEIWIDELNQWVGREDGGAQDPTYVAGTLPANRSKATQSSNDEDDYKGGLSDAFKRAGVQWGIARDLYREPERVSVPADPVAAPVAMKASAPLVAEEIPMATPGGHIGNAPGEPGCVTEEQFKSLNMLKKNMGLSDDVFKQLWSWAKRERGWSRGEFDFRNTKTWDFSKGFNLPSEAYEILKNKAQELQQLEEEPF